MNTPIMRIIATPKRSYRRPACSIKTVPKSSNEYFGCHCEERSDVTIPMASWTSPREELLNAAITIDAGCSTLDEFIRSLP